MHRQLMVDNFLHYIYIAVAATMQQESRSHYISELYARLSRIKLGATRSRGTRRKVPEEPCNMQVNRDTFARDTRQVHRAD